MGGAERGVQAHEEIEGFFALLMEKESDDDDKAIYGSMQALFILILIGGLNVGHCLPRAIKFNDTFDCILYKRQLGFKFCR